MGEYEEFDGENRMDQPGFWYGQPDKASKTTTCEVIGDYHIIDPDNGLYEVWYVNPHDPHDDSLLSEHETLHEARMNAVCMVQVDKILDAAGDV